MFQLSLLSFLSQLTFSYRHPEELDEMEEDEDETEPGPPPSVPQIPERFRNGQ
jgi:hypothetical protein